MNQSITNQSLINHYWWCPGSTYQCKRLWPRRSPGYARRESRWASACRCLHRTRRSCRSRPRSCACCASYRQTLHSSTLFSSSGWAPRARSWGPGPLPLREPLLASCPEARWPWISTLWTVTLNNTFARLRRSLFYLHFVTIFSNIAVMVHGQGKWSSKNSKHMSEFQVPNTF